MVKFATALLACSRGSSSQMVCRATSNSSVLSYASTGVYDTFPALHPTCNSPAGSNAGSLGLPILLSEAVTALCPPPKIWRRKSAKSSISLPRIVRFHPNFVQCLDTSCRKYYKNSRSRGIKVTAWRNDEKKLPNYEEVSPGLFDFAHISYQLWPVTHDVYHKFSRSKIKVAALHNVSASKNCYIERTDRLNRV